MIDRSERRQRLAAKFRVVASERIARLDAAFDQLQSGSGGAALADETMREVHTLKGEAKLIGFDGANELSHLTEELLAWARERRFRIPAEASDLVYRGLDLIRAELDEAKPPPAQARAGFAEAVRALVAAEGPGSSGEDAPGAAVDPSVDRGPRIAPVPPAPTATGGPTESSEPSAGAAPANDAFIRVPASMLLGLGALASELLSRQETTGRATELLLPFFRSAKVADARWQREADRRIRWMRDAQLETRLRVEELQDRIRRMRLLEVRALFDRFPAAIRALAREQGKRVRVVIEGAGVTVDEQILNQIEDSLLHLVRNGVDHGIETPEARRENGKPEQATLTLAARQVGSRVEIRVGDDGRGLEVGLVRASAIRKGLLSEAQASAMEDEEILQLVFRPGFSTRTEVTELSGRGVGLDVVKSQVERLGGSVRLATRAGEGTVFTLHLPISIALTRVLVFEAAGAFLAVPTPQVDRVERPSADAVEEVGTGRALRLDGHRMPLVDSGRVVGRGPKGPSPSSLEVVVLQHDGRKVALEVSALHGERLVVQRPLGRFLEGVKGLSGCVVLDEGRVGLVLNVPELIRMWGEGHAPLVTRWAAGETVRERARVLIVDDSELTRDMLVSAAERLALETTEAVDGKDALSCIRERVPDLILTDLDMPRMDGFALLEALRADALTHDTPVVVLSTRGSEEDKRRALDAGADAYLVKSEFNEADLQRMLDRFLDPASR